VRPRSLTLSSYQWLNLLLLPFFIAGFLGLGAAWALIFHYLGEQRASSFPPAVFLFKPFSYGIVFGVPAILLGIFTAFPVIMLLGRLVLGRRRFLEYVCWDEGRLQHQGSSPEAMLGMLSFLALIIGVFSAIFACLVLNWYMRFTEEEIAIKRLFGFGEEVHSYDSVEQIVLTTQRQQGKEIVTGSDLGLRFSDGRTWCTDQTFALPRDPDEQKRLLDFLQRKTGKPITRARLLQDLPGW
jgi:hypothetical protein